jgi:putative membrane protein
MAERSGSDGGTGIDPRLLQANERTMLAWMRTGIALMTFGFVIARIGVWLRALGASTHAVDPHSFGTAWLGGAFVVLGVAGNALAIRRYLAIRGAIRRGQDIRDDAFPVVFAVLLTVLGAVLGGYLLIRLL